MKAGTTYSKKQYKLYYRLYSIVGIILIILGIFFAIVFPPVGIMILVIGIPTFVDSRSFKKSSIEGGHSKEVEDFVSTSEVGEYIKFNDNTKQIFIYRSSYEDAQKILSMLQIVTSQTELIS